MSIFLCLIKQMHLKPFFLLIFLSFSFRCCCYLICISFVCLSPFDSILIRSPFFVNHKWWKHILHSQINCACMLDTNAICCAFLTMQAYVLLIQRTISHFKSPFQNIDLSLAVDHTGRFGYEKYYVNCISHNVDFRSI